MDYVDLLARVPLQLVVLETVSSLLAPVEKRLLDENVTGVEDQGLLLSDGLQGMNHGLLVDAL